MFQLLSPKASTFRVCVLSLFILVLSACSGLQVNKSPVEPQLTIDQLLNEKKYSAAIDEIDSLLELENPDKRLLGKRKEAIKKLRVYERNTINSARKLGLDNRWYDAETLLSEALALNYTSQRLLQEKKIIVKKREEYYQTNLLLMAILRSKHIPDEKQILLKMKKAQSQDEEVDKLLASLETESSEMRSVLMDKTRETIALKKWSLAFKFVSLAEVFLVDKESKSLKAKIEKNLKIDKVDELTSQIERGDLLLAQRTARRLKEFGRDEHVDKALNDLTLKVDARIKELTEEGQRYYIVGQLDLAIDNWQLALQLDPKNSDIKSRLHRAKLFKSNYNKLNTQ